MTRPLVIKDMAGVINAAKLISRKAHNVPGNLLLTEM
jgi:hypothetical protein